MSTSIAIIDYGMGNLHSVASALQHVAPDSQVRITDNAQHIADADHVVFPGVGAIRDCMAEIRRLGVDKVVQNTLQSGKPLLAICVGMQTLMDSSEENEGCECLSIFPGQTKFFGGEAQFAQARDESSPSRERLKVPHMGWNQVKQVAHPLWHNIDDESRFYFVHSYFVNCLDTSAVAGTCHYGLDFTAALARDNLFAVQFHPEKSHHAGLQLLKNFVAWDGKP